MDSTRTIARIVGSLLLAAFLAYGIGMGIMSSIIEQVDVLTNIFHNKTPFTIGLFLIFTNTVIVITIAISLFPILKQYNEWVAFSYLCTRIIEGIGLILGAMHLFSISAIAEIQLLTKDLTVLQYIVTIAIQNNFIAYQVAMAVLGLGSLPFCYLLYKQQLIPKELAILGLIGYSVLLVGTILELFGWPVGIWLSIPGGFFEVILAFYLLIRGFNMPKNFALRSRRA